MFDTTDRQLKQDLQALYDLFDAPEKWTKGVMARDKDGRDTFPSGIDAVCWCLIGGMAKIVGNADHRYYMMGDALHSLVPHIQLTKFNDDPATTWWTIHELIWSALDAYDQGEEV